MLGITSYYCGAFVRSDIICFLSTEWKAPSVLANCGLGRSLGIYQSSGLLSLESGRRESSKFRSRILLFDSLELSRDLRRGLTERIGYDGINWFFVAFFQRRVY